MPLPQLEELWGPSLGYVLGGRWRVGRVEIWARIPETEATSFRLTHVPTVEEWAEELFVQSTVYAYTFDKWIFFEKWRLNEDRGFVDGAESFAKCWQQAQVDLADVVATFQTPRPPAATLTKEQEEAVWMYSVGQKLDAPATKYLDTPMGQRWKNAYDANMVFSEAKARQEFEQTKLFSQCSGRARLGG